MEDRSEAQERILVVDDSPETLGIIRSALEQKNYLVSVAKTGEKAIKIATEYTPDLILLDILMPQMNGYDTCIQLKRSEITKDIPIIFLTGISDTEDKVKGFSLGAVDFLTKPIEIEELMARVNTHLSIYRLNKKLEDVNKNLEGKIKERTLQLSELNIQLLEEIEERKEKEKEVNKRSEDLNAAYEELSAVEEELRANYEELKDKETQLLKSESRIKELVELLPQTIFELDINGIVTSVNKIGLETFRILPEDISKGIKAIDLIRDEERESAFKHINRVLDKIPLGGKEYCAKRKDGTLFPAIIYANAIIEDNIVVGIRGIVIDVTDKIEAREALVRKNEELQVANEELLVTEDELKNNFEELYLADERLKASEIKFRDVLENSIVALYKRNYSEDIYDYISPAFTDISGYLVDEILNLPSKYILNLIHPEDRQRIIDSFGKIIKNGGGKFRLEYRLKRKDNKYIWIADRGKIIVNSDNTPVSGIGSLHDINARKIAENGLSKATRKLNYLNTSVITEIQNALFSLNGYNQILKESTDDENITEFINCESKIIGNISELVKFSKMFQSLGIKPPIRQNVMQTFLFGISHLDMSAYKREINLEGVDIYADPLLEQVFFILAENVIQHSKTASIIRLGYFEYEKGLVIFFEDNGQGILNDKKEEIFERLTADSKGTGLFLAREILSITDINIKETGVFGSSTRFEIIIPKDSYWIEKTDSD